MKGNSSQSAAAAILGLIEGEFEGRDLHFKVCIYSFLVKPLEVILFISKSVHF